MNRKRKTILLCAAFCGLAFTGCVREYTCQCTVKYSGYPGLPDSSLKEYRIRDTKKNAQSLCEQNSFTADTLGIKTTESCSLY